MSLFTLFFINFFVFCFFFFFFNDTATTEIYTSVNTLSLHDALPILWDQPPPWKHRLHGGPSRSEEHTSELQSLTDISYAVFCLKKKNTKKKKQKLVLYCMTNNNKKK